ncbi:MAG: alpha/beta hydrolase [Chloroflexota bacterium]
MSDLNPIPPLSTAGTAGADLAATRRHRVRNTVAIVVVAIALVTGYLFLRPTAITVPAASTRNPASSFADATTRIADIVAGETADPAIDPTCRTKVYDHGAPTAKVVVLFHGYTNCPKQYDALAAQLADLGYTVYVPRMPHHGEVPGARNLLGTLSGDEIAAHADTSIDIARGLGGKIIAVGLSGGGTVTSYVAQFREDVSLAIPIAAFLVTGQVPQWLAPAFINALDTLPPIDARDPAPDEAIRGAFPHGASDTSTHGATAYMRVGQAILGAASTAAPAAGRVIVVINDADTTVNNDMIVSLYAHWSDKAADRVELVRFPASMGLLHDLITPDRDGARTDVVYPALIELIGQE